MGLVAPTNGSKDADQATIDDVLEAYNKDQSS